MTSYEFGKKEITGLDKTILVKEVNIPVPWGKVAGKWWGSTKIKPILCLHGTQDNCGTFDPLISFLIHDGISFLAIDLPGHGYSSAFPEGMIYSNLNYLILLNMICDYFEWKTVSFMGHSLGAMLSFSFAKIYPAKVNFLILIDALKMIQFPKSAGIMKFEIDRFMKYQNSNNEELTYTMQELVDKVIESNSIKPDSVRFLLERKIQPSKKFPGKYYLLRDPRIKVIQTIYWPQEQVVKDSSKVTHPVFICKAKEHTFWEPKENYYSILDVLKKSSRDCDFHMLDGNHFLHLNEPEKIGKHIKNFLSRHYVLESILMRHSVFCKTPPSPLKFHSKI